MGDRSNRGPSTGRRNDGGGRRDDRSTAPRSSSGRGPRDSGEDRQRQFPTKSSQPPIITLDEGGGGGGRPQHQRAPQHHHQQQPRHGGNSQQVFPQQQQMMAPVEKKKFTGRCRLFIGNLTTEMKEEDLRTLFKKYGEVSEAFVSPRGFGFIRLDTRAHAEAAKDELDLSKLNGRQLRVRFAVHGAALKVKELSPYVSNELLEHAFSQFGAIERCIHLVDDKGRPTGEGIVEFERKNNAADALKRVSEGVFLLGTAPHPIIVEPLEQKDDDDGLMERMIPPTAIKMKEREQGPRFAGPRSFEQEFGQRFKELYQMERLRREQLEQELRETRERLEADMDLAYQDYQTEVMREELRRRQEELEAMEASKVARMEQLKRRDEERGMRGQHPFGGFPGAPQFGGGPPPGFDQPLLQRGGNPFDQQFGQPPIAPQQPFDPTVGGMPLLGRDEHGSAQSGQLSTGVQKLLQMFRTDGSGGGGGQPGTSADPNLWGDMPREHRGGPDQRGSGGGRLGSQFQGDSQSKRRRY